jgi:hypothetical protein
VTLDDEDVGHVPRTAPGDRALSGERAPAGDDDDVGSETRERPSDSGSQGVVVSDDPLCSRKPKAAQVDRRVARQDLPRSPRDGLRGVDDGELELRQLRDAVEERRSVRRGLREDGSDPERSDA